MTLSKVFLFILVCGLIGAAVFASFPALALAGCTRDADCGAGRFTGGKRCIDNNLYESFVSYSCSNPGTTFSACVKTSGDRIKQTCTANQVCESGLWFAGCAERKTGSTIATPTPTPTSVPSPAPTTTYPYSYYNYAPTTTFYQAPQTCYTHAIKGCIYNSVYWYNSCGTQEGIYQNCNATGQSCQDGKCVGSVVYPQATAKSSTKTTAVTTTAAKADQGNLVISIFAKKSPESSEWQKNIEVIDEDPLNFLVTVKNISSNPIDDVTMRVNFGNSIAYTGNLYIDNLQAQKDISTSLELGTIPAKTSRAISFTGRANEQNGKVGIKIVAEVSGLTLADSDFMLVNIGMEPQAQTPSSTEQASAQPSVTEEKTATASVIGSGLKGLFSRWYIWAVAVGLIFLFIVIFRKLSSQV